MDLLLEDKGHIVSFVTIWNQNLATIRLRANLGAMEELMTYTIEDFSIKGLASRNPALYLVVALGQNLGEQPFRLARVGLVSDKRGTRRQKGGDSFRDV